MEPFPDHRDLDQLRDAVADLVEGQGLQEREVEDDLPGGVEGAEAVLALAVVDGHLDRDARVDEPDQRGGHADVVGGPAEHRAGEPRDVRGQAAPDDQHGLRPEQPERGEGVDDPLHGAERLVGLPDRHGEHRQREAVMVEVGVHLLAVEAVAPSRRPP